MEIAFYVFLYFLVGFVLVSYTAKKHGKGEIDTTAFILLLLLWLPFYPIATGIHWLNKYVEWLQK